MTPGPAPPLDWETKNSMISSGGATEAAENYETGINEDCYKENNVSRFMKKSMSSPALNWLVSPALSGRLMATYEELADPDSEEEDSDF